jgi:hypothetical protein
MVTMNGGGLNDILKALLDGNKDTTSHQELISLLKKIEDDATEICHSKYGIEEKITFNNIDHTGNSDAYLLGRQDVRSIECIRQSIKKNLDLMSEKIKATFRSYLIQCGEDIDQTN